MTISQVILSFMYVIFIGSLIGIAVRCKQEGFYAQTLLVAYPVFVAFVLFVLLTPLIIPYIAFNDEELRKKSITTRLWISLILVFLSIWFTFIRLPDLLQRQVWNVLAEFNSKLKNNRIKQKKKLRVMEPVRNPLYNLKWLEYVSIINVQEKIKRLVHQH